MNTSNKNNFLSQKNFSLIANASTEELELWRHQIEVELRERDTRVKNYIFSEKFVGKNRIFPSYENNGSILNQPTFDSLVGTSECNANDVHAAHCCKEHGCKYGEDDCPVVSGAAEQRYPCIDCKDE